MLILGETAHIHFQKIRKCYFIQILYILEWIHTVLECIHSGSSFLIVEGPYCHHQAPLHWLLTVDHTVTATDLPTPVPDTMRRIHLPSVSSLLVP